MYVKDTTGKVIGYTMRFLNPANYQTLNDFCQNSHHTPTVFQVIQIAQGIIQGMKDMKTSGMKACPEHDKNSMVHVADFKDVILIDWTISLNVIYWTNVRSWNNWKLYS